jgi:hypothetical protein
MKPEGCDYFGSRPEIECGGFKSAYARRIAPHQLPSTGGMSFQYFLERRNAD